MVSSSTGLTERHLLPPAHVRCHVTLTLGRIWAVATVVLSDGMVVLRAQSCTMIVEVDSGQQRQRQFYLRLQHAGSEDGLGVETSFVRE